MNRMNRWLNWRALRRIVRNNDPETAGEKAVRLTLLAAECDSALMRKLAAMYHRQAGSEAVARSR